VHTLAAAAAAAAVRTLNHRAVGQGKAGVRIDSG
jgi:hypothetical protein